MGTAGITDRSRAVYAWYLPVSTQVLLDASSRAALHPAGFVPVYALQICLTNAALSSSAAVLCLPLMITCTSANQCHAHTNESQSNASQLAFVWAICDCSKQQA